MCEVADSCNHYRKANRVDLFVSVEQIIDSTLSIREYPLITNPRANREHVFLMFFVPKCIDLILFMIESCDQQPKSEVCSNRSRMWHLNIRNSIYFNVLSKISDIMIDKR